jgi:hypothetical protein
MIQKNLLCVSQFQFPYVLISIPYKIPSVTVMQQNRQPHISMLPDCVIFVSKMFITPKSIKDLPIITPKHINA